MSIYKSLNNKYRNYLILIALIIFMSVLTGICNQINVIELLIFVCFQIFCIIFPGIAIMIIIPIKNVRNIEVFVLSYVSGYILTIFLYAIVMIFCGKGYIRIAFIIMAVIAMGIILLKKNKEKEITEESDEKMWVWLVLIIFLVSLVVFSLRWKIPYAEGKNYYEADFLYWAGDIVSLTKKFPPVDFRTLRNDYRYHYLGALQQAAIASVTGIPAMKVATCYSYIEAAIFMGLSSYVVVSRVIKNNIVKVLTLVLMLFSTGYEWYGGVTYIWHIYLVPMSYNIAQSLGVIVILLLLIQLENERMDIYNLILGLCILLCCIGTKSAAGVVVLCGFLSCYLYLFLSQSNKRTVYTLLVVSVIILGGAVIYLWPTAKLYSITINLPQIIFSKEGILQFIYECIDWIIFYMRNIIRSNPWIYIPAFWFAISSIVHKKIKKEYILFFILIVVGTLGNYAISFYGHSQMYFSFMAFPVAALLTGCWIEKIFSEKVSDRKQLIITGVLSVAVLLFTVCADYKGYFHKYFITGLRNLNIPNTLEEGDTIISVSHAECQAYVWINENTDEDALLLSDRVFECAHDPTGILSERYVYWINGEENRELGAACYNGDDTILEQYSGLGIDYVVQTKRLSPKFICPESKGELVFDNEEVAVYKLF